MKELSPDELNEINRHLEGFEERDKFRNENADKILSTINRVLKERKIETELKINDLDISKGYIGDLFNNSKRLSTSIIQHSFPSIPCAIVYHYTSLESAIEILKSNSIRLHAIRKYLPYDEFHGFYTDLGLDGYVQLKKSDPNLYDTIVDGLFIGSFTGHSDSDDLLWERFGAGRSGVKLGFKISSKIPDFRKIAYHWSGPNGIIRDISKKIKSDFGCSFCFSEFSKLGAFYIPNFESENEYRLLVKNGSDRYSFQSNVEINSSGNKYIELKMGKDSNPYYDISIETVTPGAYCDKRRLEIGSGIKI